MLNGKVQKQILIHMNHSFYDKSNTVEQWQKNSLCNKSIVYLYGKNKSYLVPYTQFHTIDLNVKQNKK